MEIAKNFKNATLEEAHKHLTELRSIRKDYVVPFTHMGMTADPTNRVVFQVEDEELSELGVSGSPLTITAKPSDHALKQISARLGIPTRYMQRMHEDLPALAAKNFNAWCAHEDKKKKGPRKALLRTYADAPDATTGTLRAFLSNAYMVYDNLDLLALTLRKVKQANDEHGLGIEVDRCDLSEKRMYVRFVCPKARADAREALKDYRRPDGGDGSDGGGVGRSSGIVTGFVLSNSEVGAGKLTVSPRITMLACKNGMVWEDESFSRIHLGKKMDTGYIDWSQTTRRKNIELIEAEMADMIQRFASPDFLAQRVKDIEEMAARNIQYPREFINNMCETLGMTEEEHAGIFNAFIKQGDQSSVFAAAQAITWHAHEANPDRRHELETAATGLMSIADKCDRPETAKVYNVQSN